MNEVFTDFSGHHVGPISRVKAETSNILGRKRNISQMLQEDRTWNSNCHTTM